MSNEYRKIDADMVRAMLDGAVLETTEGHTAQWDPAHERGPFLFFDIFDEAYEILYYGWKRPIWRIREPKTRPMTRMERLGVLTREGCVVRGGEAFDWAMATINSWADPKTAVDADEWAIIDRDGEVIDGPHKFEVEI